MTIADIILVALREWEMPARDINDGYCLDFAKDVADRYRIETGEGAEIWGVTGFHYYLKINGLFFDAEVPEGVKQFLDLPIFDRQLGHPSGKVSQRCMKKYCDLKNHSKKGVVHAGS